MQSKLNSVKNLGSTKNICGKYVSWSAGNNISDIFFETWTQTEFNTRSKLISKQRPCPDQDQDQSKTKTKVETKTKTKTMTKTRTKSKNKTRLTPRQNQDNDQHKDKGDTKTITGPSLRSRVKPDQLWGFYLAGLNQTFRISLRSSLEKNKTRTSTKTKNFTRLHDQNIVQKPKPKSNIYE